MRFGSGQYGQTGIIHTKICRRPKVCPVPDLVSTILAKALVMLVEALLARLFLHLIGSRRYRGAMPAGAAG
jgi:hypothetical protein